MSESPTESQYFVNLGDMSRKVNLSSLFLKIEKGLKKSLSPGNCQIPHIDNTC